MLNYRWTITAILDTVFALVEIFSSMGFMVSSKA